MRKAVKDPIAYFRGLVKKSGWTASKPAPVKPQETVAPVVLTAPKAYCKPFAGSVYIFCRENVLKEWGIGHEGEKRALGNCN
jgi:hypothetical protein